MAFRTPVQEKDFNGMKVFALNWEAGDALVLYLHGGAYINGFNQYQWRFMDTLAAEANCRVIAPAYHLAPWADYARAYDDLTALYRALLEENPGRRLILMGDSAGGGLALGLAEALAGGGDPLPERLILFSPWVDVSMDNPDIAGYLAVEPILHFALVKVHGQYWAGEADTRHWQVSPLFGDMTHLPPVTIYCGTRELLYPDILLARDQLAAAKVDVTLRVGQGLNHDWPLMPIPEAEEAFREIVGEF
jgi:acetyl esterase/lipase